MPTVEFIITGKVQGVFYRGSARQKAAELGLTGWIKNRSDGSVLLRATGSAAALAALEAWCKEGPPGAQVLHVEINELPNEAFQSFRVIR